MRVSPGLYYVNPDFTSLEDNIDFWYDSVNDCYTNNMGFDMIATYVEAIGDEDTE